MAHDNNPYMGQIINGRWKLKLHKSLNDMTREELLESLRYAIMVLEAIHRMVHADDPLPRPEEVYGPCRT